MDPISAVSAALLHFIWQGAAISVTGHAVLAGMSRARSSSRYTVAFTTLLLMAIAPVFTILFLSGADMVVIAPTIFHSGEVGSKFVAAAQASSPTWSHWTVLIWLAGVALFAFRNAGGLVLVARRMRASRVEVPPELARAAERLRAAARVSRRVRIFLSSWVDGPCVYGILRPVIVFPVSVVANMPPGHVEAILAHEIAHVKRHDFLANCFQLCIECLLFYHPAVWWISARVREERENCCDDIAVSLSGDRILFSRALLAFEELRQTSALLPAATGGNLYRRIARLTGRGSSPSVAVLPQLAIALVALAFIAGGGWLLAGPGQAAPDTPPPSSTIATPPSSSSDPIELELTLAFLQDQLKAMGQRAVELEGDGSKLRLVIEQVEDLEKKVARVKLNIATLKEQERRLRYSKERFGSADSDRGRVYRELGPPEELAAYPPDRELWRYRATGTEYEFTGTDRQLTRVRLHGKDYRSTTQR